MFEYPENVEEESTLSSKYREVEECLLFFFECPRRDPLYKGIFSY